MAPLMNHTCLVTCHEGDAPNEGHKNLGCEAALSTLDTLDDVLDTFQVRPREWRVDLVQPACWSP